MVLGNLQPLPKTVPNQQFLPETTLYAYGRRWEKYKTQTLERMSKSCLSRLGVPEEKEVFGIDVKDVKNELKNNLILTSLNSVLGVRKT